jgi:hypothetical protein
MNPGSEIAIDAGCRCPVEQNNYGRGLGIPAPKDYYPVFLVFPDCPLHGWERPGPSPRRVLREGEIAKL